MQCFRFGNGEWGGMVYEYMVGKKMEVLVGWGSLGLVTLNVGVQLIERCYARIMYDCKDVIAGAAGSGMNVNERHNTISRNQQMKDNTFQEHLLHGSKRCFVKHEFNVLHFGWEAMLSESI